MNSLIDLFKLYQKNNVLAGDDLNNFYLRLGIDDEGCTNYVLSYIGECKKFAVFGENNIYKLMERMNLSGNLNERVKQIHEEIMTKDYEKYMKYTYEQTYDTIYEVNKQNGIIDTRNQYVIRCSNAPPGPDGIVEFIDPLDQLYIDLFGKWIVRSPVYQEYMNYVKVEKKRVGLKLNEFSYIKTFLNTFKTVEDLTNKTMVDNFLDRFPPLLFEDFITWKNKL